MNDLIQQPRSPRWPLIVITLGLVVFGIYASTHMVAAGDTWVALACGRHFANHEVDTDDPFSFNSHDAGPSDETLAKYPKWTHGLIRTWHPTGWINQNWLTHLIFYKLVQIGRTDGELNYNMLVYWKYAVYILTAVCIYFTARVLGVSRLLALAAACFGVVIGRTFYDIRPAAYSNLLVPATFLVFALATYKNQRFMWLLVPLVVFWCNVHGGYLYAFIMLAAFLMLHVLARLPKHWTFSICSMGLWLVLYLIPYRFLNHEHFQILYQTTSQYADSAIRETFSGISLFSDKAFYVVGVLILASIFLTIFTHRRKELFYVGHIFVTLILFFFMLSRLMLKIPGNLSPQFKQMVQYLIAETQIKYMGVTVLGAIYTFTLTWHKKNLITLPVKQIFQTVIIGTVSFIAMIVFNPFHLTNLTHTFEISVSEHASSWRMVSEWRPAFDRMDPTTTRANPVGEEEAFAVFLIALIVVLVIWVICRFLKPQKPPGKGRRSESASGIDEIWPKIDLSMMTIAFLTVYMAIQSRRFIAIIGGVCPVLFLLAEQIWQMISIRIRSIENKKIEPPTYSLLWQKISWGIAGIVVLVSTLFLSVRYKRIYLDPWPSDPIRTSVFMRMTASNVKPFEVCDFINLNGLKGRMFNYWTEGGAVSFGQDPDPATGQIPLQLFMDGRAQAAYNHDKYETWQRIYSGGSIAVEAARKGRELKNKDYQEIGNWISRELRKRDVWAILFPNTQLSSTFMGAVLRSNDWKTVYHDATQRILVDIKSDPGKAIAEKVITGKAMFSNDFSRHLSIATLILEKRDVQFYSELGEHARKAFEIQPCAASMMTLRNASKWKPISDSANGMIRDYLQTFLAEKEKYQNQSGYIEYASVAMMAADHLAELDREKAAEYSRLVKTIKADTNRINNNSVW